MKPYKVMGKPYEFLKQKFAEMEKLGLIKRGKSKWGTAVMTIPKESAIEPYRAVQNFKKVNSLTNKDRYPLRLIELIIVKVTKKRWKCVLDL